MIPLFDGDGLEKIQHVGWSQDLTYSVESVYFSVSGKSSGTGVDRLSKGLRASLEAVGYSPEEIKIELLYTIEYYCSEILNIDGKNYAVKSTGVRLKQFCSKQEFNRFTSLAWDIKKDSLGMNKFPAQYSFELIPELGPL